MTENRFPHLIDWAITEVCNLDCKHCRGVPGGELSTERARELIGEIARLKPGWVIVEGGEPLLRRDLFELLGLMRERGLEVHLISNGTLLTREVASIIKQMGVRLMISIDGATKDTYESIRAGADFDRVLDAARMCAAEGILEAINTTIMKRNYREIPGIFELAASIGVRRLTFIGLKPCQSYIEELLEPDENREAIILACRSAEKTGIEFFFDEPFFWATVRDSGLSAQMPAVATGILAPHTSTCIFGEYLFIETNGKVKPCSFSPLAIGDVREKRLDEIWSEALSSPFLQRLREPATRNGRCHSCEYLNECKGCRSRTFVLTGDWFASDPVCPLSLKLASERRAI